MKEFDFDELDKAVNSLMGDVKKPTTPAVTDSAVVDPEPAVDSPQTANQSANPVVPSAPVSEVLEPTADVPPEMPALTPPSSPAPEMRRAGGRFMDVVHPSSDMKTPTRVVVPSREGINLRPLTPVDSLASPKAMNDVIALPVKRAEPQSDMPVDEPKATEPELESPTEAESTSTLESSEPWSSPFLPDTQVEKRPLGGLSGASDTGLSDAIAAELAKEHPDIEPAPTPKEDVPSSDIAIPSGDTEPTTLAPNLKSDPFDKIAEPVKSEQDLQLAPEFDEKIIPAELDNDLVAIESGKASLAGETSEPIAAPDLTRHAAASAVLSTSSIPQQYSETPSSGDASHTPIYDNEAVHQPLNHPAKKKKGWVLIVFIIIIILLGGALGGAAYYFGLI